MFIVTVPSVCVADGFGRHNGQNLCRRNTRLCYVDMSRGVCDVKGLVDVRFVRSSLRRTDRPSGQMDRSVELGFRNSAPRFCFEKQEASLRVDAFLRAARVPRVALGSASRCSRDTRFVPGKAQQSYRLKSVRFGVDGTPARPMLGRDSISVGQTFHSSVLKTVEHGRCVSSCVRYLCKGGMVNKAPNHQLLRTPNTSL